ncbi:MAG: biopolymer transporter ExbD [Planctomycetia bacterium]|nr:biopolymer transporter ExbD [Planctomycetia bacterium]
MPVRIKKSSALNKLNLTPMIDVVFQLLIFFLVAARFEEAEREMDLVLPKADEAMARIAKPKEMTINVDRGGKIFLAGRNLTPEELLAVLRQAQADNPGRQTVIIRGDENCDLKYVVAVMNLCAKVDIRDCRITSAAAGN